MRFINRLCIFLLGFVMGIVGCVGGLAGGVYYAYTGLRVEDFTGTLTSKDIPVLDDDADRNFTEMSMEEIVTRFLGLMNGTKDLTIANLEEIYGLDLSSLGLPENIRNMPIDKLFEDEDSRNEALSYITLGTVAELLEMFDIDFLTEKYPHLFGKGGKLYNVSITDLIEDNGYIKALKKVYIPDLLPKGMLEEMEEGYVKDLLTTLMEAFKNISLGELLGAILNNEGSVAEIILNSYPVKNLAISDLIPEDLEPLKKLLEGIKLGDLVSIDENGDVQFSLDALLENITLRELLGLLELADVSVEEVIETLPEGDVRDHINNLLDWSLKRIIDSTEDLSLFLGDLTVGDLADFVLALIGDPDAIKNLPEPVPTLWNSVAVIGVAELIKAIEEGTLEELMNETVLALTLDDLFGGYIEESAEDLPQPVIVIWLTVRYFEINDYINNIEEVRDALMSLTLGDLIGGYVFEVIFVTTTEGWVYSYTYDKSLVNYNGRTPLLPDFICTIFDKVEDYTFEQFYQAYLCEVGQCEHENTEDCFNLTDLLGESLYNITLGELFDEFFRDEEGNSVIPEALMPLYEAVMDITVGDIVRVILGEQNIEDALKGLYELTLEDLIGGWLEEIEGLPQIVTNIFNRIKDLTVGELIEDWTCILESLYDVTIGDIVGEYIPEDDALLNLLYGAFKNISARDIMDAVNDGDPLVLLRGLARTTIREFLIDVVEALEIERSYILNNVIDCFGDTTIGDLLLVIYCKTGNCDKAAWLGHGEQCATLLGFLEKTVFTLTVADFVNEEELNDAWKVVYEVFAPISIQHIYNTIMYFLNDEAYLEADTIFTVLLETAGELTIGDIFGQLIEELRGTIGHPVPFIILSLENIHFKDIIDVIEGESDWLFIVEALEAQFQLAIEDENNLGLDERDLVYIDIIKSYIDPEHPVSIDFLIGYELDTFIENLTENGFNEKIVSIIKNLIDPIRDLTIRDIYIDYRHIFDCYNKVTFADVFAEALGYVQAVTGVWYNPESENEAATNLFNLLADYTIYDLIYDGGADEALRSVKLRDIIFLIIESIDHDDSWYDGLSDGMKGFIDRLGEITLGEIYDGDITEEDLRAILGDLRLYDLVSLISIFRDTDFTAIASLILNIKIIDIIDGNFAGILTGIRLIDLIDAVCELAGWDYTFACRLIKQLINNIGSLTIADVVGLNGELTFEDLFFILIKDITIGMFLELIPFGDSRIINVILNSNVYLKLTAFRIEAFFRGEEAIREELKVFRDVTVGDVHRLVRDIIFETYSYNTYMGNALAKQDKVSVYDLITDTENLDDYIKIMFNGEVIYTVLYTYVAPYCEPVESFLNNVFEGLFAIFSEDCERLPYMLLIYVGSVSILDIIYEPENVVEHFKAFPVAGIVIDVLTVCGYVGSTSGHFISKVIEKLFLNSMYITVGNIISAIQGDEVVTFEAIIEFLLMGVTVGDVVFDVTFRPFLDKNWMPKEGYEQLTEEYFYELVESGEVTEAVAEILISDLIFDIDNVVESLRPLTFKDLFENVVALVYDGGVETGKTLGKLIENGDGLSMVDTFTGKYEIEYVVATLFDGIKLMYIAEDILTVLYKTEVIDQATYDKFTTFNANTEIVKYTFDYEVLDIIQGLFTVEGYLDGIYFYYVTTDLAENVLILLGEAELGSKIGAFGELIDSAMLKKLIEAESIEMFVYELFDDATLGDLYDILNEQDICDLKEYEKKFDLFREVLIAELICNFTPDVLFRDLVVGDFIGEEMGWIKSAGQYVGSGNDELANSKVADLINEYLDWVPEKLRNFVVFLLGGITVLLYGYVNEYTIDQIIGDKLAESVKDTEFYQALAFVSLKKLLEDSDATIARIDNLTFGDLYRFVAAIINEYLVNIDCVLNTVLFEKFEDNLDQIKLSWIAEEGKLTVEMFFGGLSLGDTIRSIIEITEIDFNEIGTDFNAVITKLLKNLDKIELLKISEYGYKDYIKGITYGDALRVAEEMLVKLGVIPETLPESIRVVLDQIISNVDIIEIYNYEMLIVEVIFDDITWGHLVAIAIELWNITDDMLKPATLNIKNIVLDNLYKIEISDIDSLTLYNVFYGVSFGNVFEAIAENTERSLENVEELQLYKKLAEIYLHEVFADDLTAAWDKIVLIDVNDFVEVVMVACEYKLQTSFGKKLYANLDGLTVKFYVDGAGLTETLEVAFAGITYAELIEMIIAIFDIDLTQLPDRAEAMIEQIIDNVDCIELMNYELLTVETVLYGISVGDVVRLVLDIAEVNVEDLDIPSKTKDIIVLLLGNFDNIALAKVHEATLKDIFGTLSWRQVVEAVMQAVDADIDTLKPETRKLAEKLLKNINYPVYLTPNTTWDMLIGGITYADIVRPILEYLGVCVAQFDEVSAEHVADEAHGIEFADGTKALIGKYLSNMENAYIIDLTRGYIAIRETLDGLTIGDHLNAIYDYTGKPHTLVFENELYIDIAEITLIDMLSDMDEVIARFDDVTIGDVVELAIAFGGYTIKDEIKELQLYKKVMNIKVAQLINDTEAVEDAIYTIDVNDIVEIVLYVLDYALQTELAKVIYDNLNELTLLVLTGTDMTVSELLEIIFDGVTYGMLYEHIAGFATIEEATENEIKALNIYNYVKDVEIVDSIINTTDEFLQGMYFNWFTTDVAAMILRLNGNNNAAIYTEAFAELTEEATVYVLANSADINEFIHNLFGASTLGTIMDILGNLNVFKIEEQIYGKKFDLFRTVLIADLICNFTPDTLFRDIVVGDLIGEEIGWFKNIDDEWVGTFDDEFANRKVADIINDWLSFIPECLRNLVAIALGGASAILLSYVQDKTIDEVVGDKLPERIKENAIYKAIAFVSVRKLIEETDAVKSDLEALTLGDAYDLVIAIVSCYVYDGIDDIVNVDLMKKLRSNLGEIKLLEADTIVLDQLLKTITYGDVANAILYWTNIDVESLDEPLRKVVEKLINNLSDIEVLKYKLLCLDTLAYNINCRETVELVAWIASQIMGEDIDLDAMFEPEMQKLVSAFLGNLEKIMITELDEVTAAKLIGSITYGMVARAILELADADIDSLGKYSKELCNKLLGNLDEIEILEVVSASDLLMFIEGITYGDVINAAMELLQVSVANEIRELQLYKKIAAIYLTDAFDNRSVFFGTLKSIDINDIIEVVLYVADYELQTEAGNKLYNNCDTFTFEYLMDSEHTAIVIVLDLFDTITIGELANAVGIIAPATVKVTDAVDKLIGEAQVTLLITAGSYSAFIEELFGDSNVNDVCEVLKDFGINIDSNEYVAYYTGLFGEVLLRNIFSDPTPENIFLDMTWADVLGPVCGFSKDESGRYQIPSNISEYLIYPLMREVADTLYEIFAGLHPYIITAIAVDVAVHVTIIVCTVIVNREEIMNLLNVTISEILEQTGLKNSMGIYGEIIDSVIGDANVLYLLFAQSYDEFISELFGDSTLKDMLQYFTIYNEPEYETIKGLAELFENRKFAEILVDPSPAVIFGNVTLGQIVGPFLGWTPKNADKTIWSGTGLLAAHANRMVVDIIDSIEGFNTLHPHIQTAIIAVIAGVGIGGYAALSYYAPEINHILSGMTIKEIFLQTDIASYMDGNRGTFLAEVLAFIYNNYGDRVPLELLNLIANEDIVELVEGIKIGDFYDIIDTTGIITDAMADEASKKVLDSMAGVYLYDVLAADDFVDAIVVLLGSTTLMDILGVEATAEGYKLGEVVIPESMLTYAEGTVFTTFAATSSVPAGRKAYTVGQMVGFLKNNTLIENYIGNIIFGEAWNLVDENRDFVDGVVGLILYRFVNNNSNRTISDVVTTLANGDAFDILMSDITAGEILDSMENGMEDKLGFLGEMLRNNENIKLVDIVNSDDPAEVLAGTTKLGDLMGFDFDATENCWKDSNGHRVDALNNAIGDIMLKDVLGGTFNMSSEISGLKLGELMNFYFDEIEGVWYKDATKTDKIDTLVAKVCPITLGELMGDNAEQTIKNALGDLYLGTIMNLTKQSDGWYNGSDKAEYIIAKIADIQLSSLFNGNFTLENVFDGKIGDYIGYTKNADGWYQGTDKADLFMNHICELDMNKLLKGQLHTHELFEGIKVGDLITNAKFDGTHWVDTEDNDKPFGDIYDKVFNIKLDDAIENGIDMGAVFSGLKLGSIIKYTYDQTTGKWYDGANEVQNPAMIRFANLDLGELIYHGLDFKELFNGLKIGEVLGLTYTYDGTTNTYTWYENGVAKDFTLLMNAMYGINFNDFTDKTKVVEAIGHLRIGDLSTGFTWDASTGKWSNVATSAEVDSMTGKILSITITQLSAGNITSLLFGGMKLGDVMFGAYYYSEGKWYVTSTNKEVYVLTARILDVSFDSLINNPNDVLQNNVFSVQLGVVMGWVSAFNGDDGEWQWQKANGTWCTPIENKIGYFNLTTLVNGTINWEYIVGNFTVAEVFGPQMDRTGILSIVSDSVKLKNLSSEINKILTEGKVGVLMEAGVINLTSSQLVSIANKIGAASSYHIELQWTLNDLLTAMTNYIINH